MKRQLLNDVFLFFFSVLAILLFFGSMSADETGLPITSRYAKEIVSLKDFTSEEVKGVGIVLPNDLTVHISAVGGGDKSFWRDIFDDNESQQMFAAGWIIDAKTREMVWEMTMDNTSGKTDRRVCEEDLALKRGSYEVYFSAYAYARRHGLSESFVNIDRRKERRSSGKMLGRFFSIFEDNNSEVYDEFMDRAKDVWGLMLTMPDGEASAIQTYQAPLRPKQTLFAATGLGDNAVVKKELTLTKDVKLHVYALGEGQKRDEVYDHGWIVNKDTRERVWEMRSRKVHYSGGASKNIKVEDDLALAKGKYELYYVTDNSHSNDDWNARPPYDPFNYGITITLLDESDRDGVTVNDLGDTESNVIVKMVDMRDDDFKSEGFTLKVETKLRVYALGEWDGEKDMADYGYIVDARTRERVWSMEGKKTYHAGGASKNRIADEIITLPKGDYIAYYQTDGSHSYNNWNSDPPYDEDHWGLTITGAGTDFIPKNVAAFSEEKETDVLAQLVRVRDHRHVRQRFTIDESIKVRIYAIGEGVDDEMADYGWIEDAKTGETVWEMTYKMTSSAGGARKNRMINRTITLDKGEYELHFRTDDSHAFNDWNDDPPEDRTRWGITIYKEQ